MGRKSFLEDDGCEIYKKEEGGVQQLHLTSVSEQLELGKVALKSRILGSLLAPFIRRIPL